MRWSYSNEGYWCRIFISIAWFVHIIVFMFFAEEFKMPFLNSLLINVSNASAETIVIT